MKIGLLTLLVVIALPVNTIATWSFVGNPLAHVHYCNGSEKVMLTFESGRAPEDENQYWMGIHEKLPRLSKIHLKFDTEAKVTLNSPEVARIHAVHDNEFIVHFFKSMTDDYFSMTVKGIKQGVIPYATSININSEEYCEKPKIGSLDDVLEGIVDTAESVTKRTSITTCGRRKVDHTELITNSQPSKPGDWPWHVAIYRFEKGTLTYKCGGTLVGKNIVVTAAHCATIRGVPIAPEVLNVVLGKYNLVGGDIASQEREVFEVKIHERYNILNLNNDIAVLKLKTEAVYDDYVQPACVWYPGVGEKLDKGSIYGTVVGWGFDHTDHLSTQLRQATMPKISDSKCLKSNPVFFGKMLNEYKFCAGYRNGTSACNGDSGGGFMVFIPDEANSESGSWYLRGIVSVGLARQHVALCDPDSYVLFTDTAKYRTWIKGQLT